MCSHLLLHLLEQFFLPTGAFWRINCSNRSGEGMKPMSQFSFTFRPTHQFPSNFSKMCRKSPILKLTALPWTGDSSSRVPSYMTLVRTAKATCLWGNIAHTGSWKVHSLGLPWVGPGESLQGILVLRHIARSDFQLTKPGLCSRFLPQFHSILQQNCLSPEKSTSQRRRRQWCFVGRRRRKD